MLSLQAVDLDQDINSDIKYAIVGDPIEKRYFNVDERTGLIRTIGGFNQLLNGTVFGFDIRATDKAGASDGKSAITNVFVSFQYLFSIKQKAIYVTNNTNYYYFEC